MAEEDLILTELMAIKGGVGELKGEVAGISDRLDRRDKAVKEDIDELYLRSNTCTSWRATHNGCLEGRRESGVQWYYFFTLVVAFLACAALVADVFIIN